MTGDNESSPPLLPCGVHTSHSEDREQRWRSPEFLAETERWRGLLKSLIRALKERRISLGPYPPLPDTYEARRIYEVKQHFSFLKNRIHRSKYLEQVEIYEKVLEDFLSLPPCRRDLKGFPLVPLQVPTLAPISELTTPRKGGRQRSQTVQERNSRIAELVRAKNSHHDICLMLDKEKWSIPGNWRKSGIYTWRQAYRMKKELVQPLISKASTRNPSS